jgi:hypothetical protein
VCEVVVVGGERRDDIGTERREVHRASDGKKVESNRIEHNGDETGQGGGQVGCC